MITCKSKKLFYKYHLEVYRSEIDEVFNKSRSKNMSILKTLEQCTTKRIASLLLEKLQIENKRINEISKNLFIN